jgi:hypothetical protein
MSEIGTHASESSTRVRTSSRARRPSSSGPSSGSRRSVLCFVQVGGRVPREIGFEEFGAVRQGDAEVEIALDMNNV